MQAAGILTSGMEILTGVAAGFEPDGRMMILAEGADEPVPALFLRTSAAPPPEIREGDRVLLAVDTESGQGIVLGLIEPYRAPARMSPVAGRNIEIALPERSDKVHVKGRTILIEAGEEIELRCGDGTIRIDRRGKVVVRGNEVLSRARGANKVKGASVAIN